MWSNDSNNISPKQFLISFINQKIHNIDFTSFNQNDCEEFLHTFFDLSHAYQI
tara:strand:- start:63 stop:221 length:159 start_codon:yes stop_codon:yes gene_type:complete